MRHFSDVDSFSTVSMVLRLHFQEQPDDEGDRSAKVTIGVQTLEYPVYFAGSDAVRSEVLLWLLTAPASTNDSGDDSV